MEALFIIAGTKMARLATDDVYSEIGYKALWDYDISIFYRICLFSNLEASFGI